MTQQLLQSTVGQLVKDRPARSRFFEKLGIDYCCGGKLLFTKACAIKGLDPQNVISQLQQDDQTGNAGDDHLVDADAMSLTQLTEHIQNTHHAYLKSELPRLGALVRKVASVHGQNYDWLSQANATYAQFAASLESHMKKEEQVLFPLIRNLDNLPPQAKLESSMSVAGPINMLESEHDHAGSELAQMRQLSDNFTPPAGACNTFIAMLDGLAQMENDMHQHVHKENNVLFPKAMAVEVLKLKQEYA